MLIVFLLPQETDPEFEKFHTDESVVNLIQETQQKSLPLSAYTVRKETEKDAVLSQVLLKINQGWPQTLVHPFQKSCIHTSIISYN